MNSTDDLIRKLNELTQRCAFRALANAKAYADQLPHDVETHSGILVSDLDYASDLAREIRNRSVKAREDLALPPADPVS